MGFTPLLRESVNLRLENKVCRRRLCHLLVSRLHFSVALHAIMLHSVSTRLQREKFHHREPELEMCTKKVAQVFRKFISSLLGNLKLSQCIHVLASGRSQNRFEAFAFSVGMIEVSSLEAIRPRSECKQNAQVYRQLWQLYTRLHLDFLKSSHSS